MKAKRNAGLESRLKNHQLTNRDIDHVVASVTAMFTPDILSMMEGLGLDPEVLIRMTQLGAHCRERRIELGWDIKEAAAKVGVPRYRIDAIESSSRSGTSRKEILTYIRILGLQDWFTQWERANRRAFSTIAAEPDGESSWARRLRKISG